MLALITRTVCSLCTVPASWNWVSVLFEVTIDFRVWFDYVLNYLWSPRYARVILYHQHFLHSSFFALLSSFFYWRVVAFRRYLSREYYLEFLEILYRFFFAWLLEIHRSVCGIACVLRKILILLRRFHAWLHVHDFYVSHGFVFSILSCQASDLGQGFYVLKFMG